MRITSDWHIHSRNSCDSACMTIADMIAETAQRGISDFGLTDHLHTPFNLPDIAASRAEFSENKPSARFHFGIEVSCVSQWELEEIKKGGYSNPVCGIRTGGPANGLLAIGITDADIERHRIEYVIAGVHWPMYVPMERERVIRDYHRQNMFLAAHPLVDIVAHPWWWMGHWKNSQDKYPAEPWFDDFRRIPSSMHDEFASAAVEHQTVVEININANLLNAQYPETFANQYLDYLAELKAKGVRLSIGSDCHSAHYDEIDFEKAGEMLSTVGIKDKDLWRLAPQPRFENICPVCL